MSQQYLPNPLIVGTLYGRRPIVSLPVLEMTNSYTAKNSGKVLAEADIDEDIIYAQISKLSLFLLVFGLHYISVSRS